MKKQTSILMAMILGIFLMFGSTMASAATYDPNVIHEIGGSGSGVGHMLTSVRDVGDEVEITLTNVRVGPIGEDTQGERLDPVTAIALYSGIMDAAGQKEPFVVAPVNNGVAVFRIPNTAKIAGVPVVEHLWGRSVDGRMALVHDPNDPFVVSENGNLQKLAIGLVMRPNRPTVSLKPYGKLDQGKHPELTQAQ